MPKVRVNDITMFYEQQGAGEPLILIPYLFADHACYAFQVAEYAKHFTCILLDPRDAGETDQATGTYSTEQLADDVAGFMQAVGIDRAHISGLSLGAAAGLWLASKYPQKVQSLSAHSSWTRSDLLLKTVLEGWQVMARGTGNVTEMALLAILPWCLTPKLFATRPEYVESLIAFVRSRPVQPVEGFIRQSTAAMRHDVSSQLPQITAPTLLTFGAHDQLTSTRFAASMTEAIPGAELVVFDHSSHAPIYEQVEEFNRTTLDFLQRHSQQ